MAGIPATCLAMIMKGSLLVLMSLCSVNVAASSSQAGEPRAVCPIPTVEAVEGETVLLQCHLDPPDNVVNNAVDWKRVDLNKVVYSYRHKRENPDDQMDQYRGRTAVNHDGFTRGDLTLLLSSVRLSDTGPYRCFVSKLMTSCRTFLTVETKDQQNTTTGDVSCTTSAPLDESHKPDDENWTFVIGAAVLVVVFALIGVLWKCGAIQKCVTRLRGQWERKGERANGAELQRLGAEQPTKDVKDQDGPAADDLLTCR